MAGETQTHEKKQTASKQQVVRPKSRELEKKAEQSNPATMLRRAMTQPSSLSHADLIRLQQTVGNQAVRSMLKAPAQHQPAKPNLPIQSKSAVEITGDKVALKSDASSKHGTPINAGLKRADKRIGESGKHQENKTGLPDNLKAEIENLSGISMDDVIVHYNSSKPAGLQALAYTQGTDIYLGPGQEKHLAHEAWHVVQQKQRRVKPTVQLQGIAFNDNSALEREADEMGTRAAQGKTKSTKRTDLRTQHNLTNAPVQAVLRSKTKFIWDTTFTFKGIVTRPTIANIDAPLERYNEEIDVIRALPYLRNLFVAINQYIGNKEANDANNPRLPIVRGLKNDVLQEFNNRYPDAANILQRINEYTNPNIRPPTEQEIIRYYANYLRSHPPAAYSNNLFTDFRNRMVHNQYYNFTTRRHAYVRDAYTSHFITNRNNMAGVLTPANFCNQIYGGQNLDNHNQLAPVAGWQNAPAAATAAELNLILGVPNVQYNYNLQTSQAIQTINAQRVHVQGFVAAGNPQTKLRSLLVYLISNNSAVHVQNVTAYNTHGVDILTNRLNPLYPPTWDAGLLTAIAASGFGAQIANYIQQPNDLGQLRIRLHAYDANANPNLTVAVRIVGRVLANAGAIGPTLNHIGDLVAAWPHLFPIANPIPFGNRPPGDPRGGLRGHFIKHVLGNKPGAVDLVEATLWLQALNLAPNGLITRASFVGAMAANNEQQIFGQTPAAANLQPATAGHVNAMLQYLFLQGVNGADVVNLAIQHENLYHTDVAQRFNGAPPNRFVYYDAHAVKINAHDGTVFMVAAYDAGANRVDLSTGFIPAGGPAGQYNQMVNVRILAV